jgi:hypothetical protein
MQQACWRRAPELPNLLTGATEGLPVQPLSQGEKKILCFYISKSHRPPLPLAQETCSDTDSDRRQIYWSGNASHTPHYRLRMKMLAEL